LRRYRVSLLSGTLSGAVRGDFKNLRTKGDKRDKSQAKPGEELDLRLAEHAFSRVFRQGGRKAPECVGASKLQFAPCSL
jgi:hypothetical protein